MSIGIHIILYWTVSKCKLNKESFFFFFLKNYLRIFLNKENYWRPFWKISEFSVGTYHLTDTHYHTLIFTWVGVEKQIFQRRKKIIIKKKSEEIKQKDRKVLVPMCQQFRLQTTYLENWYSRAMIQVPFCVQLKTSKFKFIEQVL